MVIEKKYFKRLDIIRNLSCILVLLYHLNILKGGFLAVCTFFVLSGYLSCISALKNKNFSIKAYYINRLKKIYFPLIIMVFITVIVAKINTTINWINLKQETLSVIFGYNNFWQLNANLDYFTKNVNSPFIHLWYISILIQLELVFPIIFIMLKKVQEYAKNNIATIIVFLLTFGSTFLFLFMGKTQDIMTVYYNTFARSFSFLFGVLFAIIYYKYNFMLSQNLKKHSGLFFIIYNIVLILLCTFTSAESEKYIFYMILATIISALLIKYSIIESNGIEKAGKLDKHIKAFAKISYEIYLVQYPVIFFMQNIRINDVLKTLIIIILTFIISVILHLLINFNLQSKMLKKVKIISVSIIIIIGSFIVITEKDHTNEMKELEKKLNENSKIIEENNNKYMNNENVKKEDKDTTKETKETKEKGETRENTVIDENKIAEEVRNLPVVGVGDSVLLDAIDKLSKIFPNGYFDGKISRSITSAKPLLTDLKNKGKLGDTLILSLANNGDYSDKKNKELMELLEDRKIYWVSAVGADDPKFNERFKEFASNYPNICIVEWEKASENHPEYFYADGTHPKGAGLEAYANTIYETIYNDYLEKYKQ